MYFEFFFQMEQLQYEAGALQSEEKIQKCLF